MMHEAQNHDAVDGECLGKVHSIGVCFRFDVKGV